MLKYISKRIALMLITLIIIITAVFFLLRIMPGMPKAIEAQFTAAKTPEEQQNILDSYNPDPNSFVAFIHYIKNIFHGDFGTYYASPTETIPHLFFKPMKYTLMIVGPAFLLGTLFGIVFGFISGYKRGRWPDITVNVVATFFVSVPSFVLATFLILFGDKVGLPIDFSNAEKLGQTALAIILPILIITITSFSTLTYYIRNEVVTVLTSDFITIARAKGLSEKKIFFKHVLRNVSLPFITIVVPSFISIIFGSMIIEMFFDVPGSASMFATAITGKETNVVMFSTIFFTSLSLAIQLLIDILYVVFDPRIKLGDSSRFSISRRYNAKKARESQVSKVEGEVKHG